MLPSACLYGEITFTVVDGSPSVDACPCSERRVESGGVFATGFDKIQHIAFAGIPSWYATSDGAKRGLCKISGSALSRKSHDGDAMASALGGLTGLNLQCNIFAAHNREYYKTADGPPQREAS